MIRFVLAAALTLFAGRALADPCEGKLPKPGTKFAGVVRYVGDGDGLCVGPGRDGRRWIEVRLADVYAAELNAPGGVAARDRLRRLVLGRRLECVAGRRSYDRVVAACTLDGAPLHDLLPGPDRGRGTRRR